MAALVAACSGLGRKKLAYFIKPALCLRDPKAHAGKVSISRAFLGHCSGSVTPNYVGGVVPISQTTPVSRQLSPFPG